jgi:hypothetical protein
MNIPHTYTRILDQGQIVDIMVEIDPHCFVNLTAGRALGLIPKTLADQIATTVA